MSSWHYLALFLDPRYKKLNYISDDKIVDLINVLTGVVGDMIEDNIDVVEVPEEQDEEEAIFTHRMENTELPTNEERAREIINTYRHSLVDTRCHDYRVDGSFSVIKFWVRSAERFPHLSAIALWVLSSPASSVPSECCFSLTGYTVNPRRNRLSSKMVNRLIVLNSYFNKTK